MNEKKSLVAYFSRPDENYGVGEVAVGNTELLAKEIIKKTGADEFKIIPKIPYPAGYQECVEQATRELENQDRPAYEGDIGTSAYDTIYLGYPIWWGDLPMVVYTFLENHDLAGKTIIPFNTHEGSGNSGTYESLKSKFPDSAFKGDGFAMSGIKSRTEEGIKELDAWLENLSN